MSLKPTRIFLRVLATVLLLLIPVAHAGCGSKPAIDTDRLEGARIVSRTSGKYFETYRNGRWSLHLIKGFNIGTSIPNHWPGQLAIPKSDYSRWFEQISEANANTILVYTILMPWFYEALEEFNRTHPGKELWLVQQIWPRELADNLDMYETSRADEYRREIRNGIDVLAGEADIPRRKGEAWGRYRTDVMPYTLGVLLGRELLAEEVEETNQSYAQAKGSAARAPHEGRYVRTTGKASAIEMWCAEMSDRAAEYARKGYGWLVPVGFVSWPTLDPMVHPTEFTPGGVKSKEVDDSQVLDPNHIEAGPDGLAGLFGTYQIYPYYPEFMYREPGYAEYSDEYGVLRYGGYLRQFMSIHPDYPAVIGEIGLSTSIATAHEHPEGLKHGGISEEQQGIGVARIVRSIVREGYAGAFIFEWQDEWAKKNWVTYPYMVPYERHVQWHNVMDPEQNFGILAMDPDHVPFEGKTRVWQTPREEEKTGGIRAIYQDHDAAFLYIELEFTAGGAAALKPGGSPEVELLIGIDTVGPEHGTTRLPVEGLPELPQGAEFLLRASAGSAKLQARPDYNKATSRFSAAPSDDPVFEDVVYLINRAQVSQEDGTYFPEITTNASILKYGVFMTASPAYDSLAHWYVDSKGTRVRIRLPWTMINVSDPSSPRVILDPRKLPPGPAIIQGIGFGYLRTDDMRGVHLYTALTEGGALADFQPADGRAFSVEAKAYRWKGWEDARYRERLKKSYTAVVEMYKDLAPPAPGE